MKVCPSCDAEFVDGIEQCNDCKVPLIDPAEAERKEKKQDAARDLLADKETARLGVGGGLPAAREIERSLLREDILAYIDAVKTDGAVLSAAQMQYFVVVAKEDTERVFALLKGKYQEMIDREGIGELNLEEIDLSAAEVKCPACGHQAPLADGACGDCGLFLGAPE